MIIIKDVEKINKNDEMYSTVYRELDSMIHDEDIIREIHERYKGLTITFPCKLFSNGYIRNYIASNIGKEKVQVMASYLGLSECRVRQLIKEIREENSIT